MTNPVSRTFAAAALIVPLLGIGCASDAQSADPSAAVTEMAALATMEWDPNSLVLIAPDAHYGRVAKLRDGTLVAGFSQGDSAYAARSTDGGTTWSDPIFVADYEHGAATNSEVMQLSDGRVMYMYNERDRRPGRNTGNNPMDNGIAITFSEDGGRTWSEPKRIYGGGPMWEPVGLEKPNGEILVFFADEKPYPESNEQQISVIRSRDGGETWADTAEAVSFRAKRRDGMAVPVMLEDERMVAVIEDNGFFGSFKPVIVDLSQPEQWPIRGDSELRWGALADPLPARTYAGAPYLVRLSDGQTVMSVQIDDGDGLRRMATWVGDENARNFAGRSNPFSMADSGTEQLWNALLVKDDETVSAISGTHIDGQGGLWMIDGRITNPDEQ